VLLRLESLGKRYAHADGPVDALKEVSLEVEDGAFVTITGPSGSGKTTLLLAVGGLLKPTSGRLFFRDRPLHDLTDGALAAFRREHVGFVMQSFSLIPYLTALRNVGVPLGLLGVPAKEQDERAAALLDEVGLSSRKNHLPRELSAGQQQRVAIARAMANRPALVLADEPTGNLDPGLSRDILGLLDSLNQQKKTTIIMVTHSPEAAAHGTVRAHLQEGAVVTFDRSGTRSPQTPSIRVERSC
jgi:putative ABC transport system ATP-binding protein